MAYELLSQSRKPNKWGSPNKSRGLENVLKKNKCTGGRGGVGALIRDPRVLI